MSQVGGRGKADGMAENTPAQSGDDVLHYRGRAWRVVSEPVVVDGDAEAGLELIEVWVRRGEDIE